MKTRTIPRLELTPLQRTRKLALVAAAAFLVVSYGPTVAGSSFVQDMGSNARSMVSGKLFDSHGLWVEKRYEPAGSTTRGYANLTRLKPEPVVGRERLIYHND